AVNKMDLAEYREDAFHKLQDDFLALAAQLGIASVQCVPISALEGDNVVDRSRRMPWYHGPMLLEHLETVPLPERDSLQSFRFPVQTVIRPDATFRGFAGRIASGAIRPGDPLVALHGTPLELGRTYLVKHTARQTKIRVLRIRHRVNVNTLAEEPATRLEMNEIGSVDFETYVPLFFDPYSSNRTMGSFILIDSATNATVGAGMIQESVAAVQLAEEPENEFAASGGPAIPVAPEERYARHGHFPGVVLLEGRAA